MIFTLVLKRNVKFLAEFSMPARAQWSCQTLCRISFYIKEVLGNFEIGTSVCKHNEFPLRRVYDKNVEKAKKVNETKR
jgi:hypothetical protein